MDILTVFQTFSLDPEVLIEGLGPRFDWEPPVNLYVLNFHVGIMLSGVPYNRGGRGSTPVFSVMTQGDGSLLATGL